MVVGKRKGKIIKKLENYSFGSDHCRQEFLKNGWHIISYNGTYYSLERLYINFLKNKYGKKNIQLLINYYKLVPKNKSSYLNIVPAIAFRYKEDAIEYKLTNF